MSSKSSSTRQRKVPLNDLKSKKWCFPPSPLMQSSTSGSSASTSVLSPPKSPEPNCAICLGKIEDKSFADRCFHCFCRLCLFEWAKVKAECPVCRQAFEKIIFNIRAEDDYDEQVVQTAHHRHRAFHFPYIHSFANLDGNQRFRYPTTLTPLRRRMMDFERRLEMQFTNDYAQAFPRFLDFLDNHRGSEQRLRTSAVSHAINNNNNTLRSSSGHSFSPSNRSSAQPMSGLNERHRYSGVDPMVSGQLSRQWSSGFYSNLYEMDMFPPPPGTSAHRRYIYDSDLWVLTNGDGNTNRTREVSARFFSSNPACTHRLIPWLNRELNSILQNPNETEVLIPRIMNALLMYDIKSVGFKKIVAPFTLSKTNHFIHEFYNFARSPYDMEQYSRLSVYVPRHRADVVESEPLPGPIGYHMEPDSPHSPDSISSSSSNSSIEILEDSSDNSNREMPTIASPQSPDIYSIDGSDSDVSSTEIRQLITPSPVNTPSLHEEKGGSVCLVNNDVSSTSNPTPLPSGDLPEVSLRNINIIDDFDNPKPGTSGLSRIRTTAQTKWTDSETTDVDVGDELDAAIARFEKDSKCEVKKEVNNEKINIESNDNKGNDSDSSCSSVLIVGYVKPLHERTPEIVDLISSEDQKVDQNISEKRIKSKKSKKDKKEKHRKRSTSLSRSRTPLADPHSHNKRKCKHKSRDRSKDKHRDRERHKHKSHRLSKHSRSSSTSNSSTSSSSTSDELKQLNKTFKKREGIHRKHRKHSRYEPNSEKILFDPYPNSSTERSFDRKVIASTASRPSSLGSVVIRKHPIQSESIKIKHYYLYSDSD